MLPVSVMVDKGKKVILFLVIGQVKIFLPLGRRRNRMCLIYIFNLKQEDKKSKEENICRKSNKKRWYHLRIFPVLF